jgi:hypothetical protein
MREDDLQLTARKNCGQTLGRLRPDQIIKAWQLDLKHFRLRNSAAASS